MALLESQNSSGFRLIFQGFKDFCNNFQILEMSVLVFNTKRKTKFSLCLYQQSRPCFCGNLKTKIWLQINIAEGTQNKLHFQNLRKRSSTVIPKFRWNRCWCSIEIKTYFDLSINSLSLILLKTQEKRVCLQINFLRILYVTESIILLPRSIRIFLSCDTHILMTHILELKWRSKIKLAFSWVFRKTRPRPI